MRRLAAIVGLFVSLTGFMSGDEYEFRQWQRFIGMTMSQWMEDTGLWPDSMYDEGPNARAFVLEHNNCSIQLHATFQGGSGPAAWKIIKTVHRGFCGDI